LKPPPDFSPQVHDTGFQFDFSDDYETDASGSDDGGGAGARRAPGSLAGAAAAAAADCGIGLAGLDR
jgi:hypothetical protein